MFWTFGFLREQSGGPGGPRAPLGPQPSDVRAGRFAFKLALLSIASLFVACLVAFVTIRTRAETWREDGMPGLPMVLWLSAALLLLVSVLCEAAYRGMPVRRAQRVRWAYFAGIAFCVAQAAAWIQWTVQGLPPNAPTLYAFSFYMLTAVHALHVLAGVVLLHIVKRREESKRLRLIDGRSEFLRLTTQYWHFLGLVWIVMWIALEVANG